MSRITVLLAEDHHIVREGVRSLLRHEGDIEIIAEADNGRQAVEMAKTLRPAVVVMDISMPLLNGLEAARQILHSVPAARVLMLSAHSDSAYIDQVVDIGVQGYLAKLTHVEILPKAIRQIHQGGTFFSPSVSEGIQRQENRGIGTGSPKKKKGTRDRLLSSRETEVLQLIAEGKATKEIAVELGISVKTVEKHRQTLMNKLGIHDIASLTRYAILTGVVESPHQEAARIRQSRHDEERKMG